MTEAATLGDMRRIGADVAVEHAADVAKVLPAAGDAATRITAEFVAATTGAYRRAGVPELLIEAFEKAFYSRIDLELGRLAQLARATPPEGTRAS